jgi:hypothetical protein
MPRRNRNASLPLVTPDMLADQITQIASDLVTCHDRAPLCTACLTSPATTGDYCARCQDQIILSLPSKPRRR